MPENCGSCRFFVRIVPLQPHGCCHERPPTLILVGMRPPEIAGQMPRPLTNTFWPMIPDTEWCGAWTERTAVIERRLPQIDLDRLTPDAIEGNA